MLGLISGFIAQPGACKMVTFYCFLAFSFLFLSLFSLSLLFQISTSGHKNARAAPVPLGTHSSHRDPWCPHPSFLSSSLPSATGYRLMDPSSRVRTYREAGRVIYLLPHPMSNAPLRPHFSGWQQRLAGISGVYQQEPHKMKRQCSYPSDCSVPTTIIFLLLLQFYFPQLLLCLFAELIGRYNATKALQHMKSHDASEGHLSVHNCQTLTAGHDSHS